MLITILVFLLYLFWGVTCFLCQGETYLKDRIKARDLFDLIPNYKFFCPNPVRHDYHLYYRDLRHPEEESEWKEFVFFNRNRAISYLWNPGKRNRKVFAKSVKVIRDTYLKDPNRAPGSLYKYLLAHILQHTDAGERQFIQFRLIGRRDLESGSEEQLLYHSPLHAVKAPYKKFQPQPAAGKTRPASSL